MPTNRPTQRTLIISLSKCSPLASTSLLLFPSLSLCPMARKGQMTRGIEANLPFCKSVRCLCEKRARGSPNAPCTRAVRPLFVCTYIGTVGEVSCIINDLKSCGGLSERHSPTTYVNLSSKLANPYSPRILFSHWISFCFLLFFSAHSVL
ncbi:hypothetical protein F4677DRAFT_258015 [Hypoxylon crocopeplum]|nr:hypothetical protein F4677DRAFT_258015 [Hypoxylon crocopeplum]